LKQKYAILSLTRMVDSTAAVYQQLEGKAIDGKLRTRLYRIAFDQRKTLLRPSQFMTVHANLFLVTEDARAFCSLKQHDELPNLDSCCAAELHTC